MASHQPCNVTLFTPFSPVRTWTHPIWMEGIRGAEHYIDRVFAFNNTNTEMELLKAFFKEEMDVPNIVVPYPTVFHDKPAAVRAECIARMWTSASRVISSVSKYLLSVEEDVVPEQGFLRQMMEVMEANTEIAVLGLPVRSRHTKHRMVYMTRSIDPWMLGDVVPESTDRVQFVHSVSTSCALIRTDLLKGFTFTGRPNEDGSGGNGHEWSFMKKVLLAGKKVACLNIGSKHYVDEKTWV